MIKNILTLVDFTDTAETAINQAVAIARLHNSTVTLFHVTDSEQEEEKARDRLEESVEKLRNSEVSITIKVYRGDIFHEVPEAVKHLQADLVVVGTHGIKGLRQNLFGSNIYKLVSHISTAVLVVSDYTAVVEGGFKRVLFPVAPHRNYLIKAKQTIPLLAPSAQVFLFEINKPGAELDDQVWKNLEETEQFLTEKGVDWQFIEKGSRSFSVGYSRETLDYAKAENMDLVAIMTQVSDRNRSFGKMDKENLMLNKEGLPILCANG